MRDERYWSWWLGMAVGELMCRLGMAVAAAGLVWIVWWLVR